MSTSCPTSGSGSDLRFLNVQFLILRLYSCGSLQGIVWVKSARFFFQNVSDVIYSLLTVLMSQWHFDYLT
jgi:hypothetical protein